MGSIASVLQWHCEKCTLINPTEQVKCIRCGTAREFKPPRKSGFRGRSASFNERSFKYSTFTSPALRKDSLSNEPIILNTTVDSNVESSVKTRYVD